MKKYDHLFFDLDHTLWDFEANSEAALSIIFDQMHLSRSGVPTFEIFMEHYRKVNANCWALYKKGKIKKEELRHRRFGETLACFGIEDPQLGSVMGEAYLDLSPKQTRLMPGTLETLNYLAERGYAMHIITNGFSEVQHTKMQRSGLESYFDQIIISEVVGANKPDKRVFHHALKAARAQKHGSLMIGDDLHADILGARNAGMDQVYFNPNGHYHRRKLTHEVRELKELKGLL